MKRRVFLLFGSFLAILLAFAVYYFIAGGSVEEDAGAVKTSNSPKFSIGDEATTKPQKHLFIVVRDEQGLRQGIYQAPDWEKLDDGSYLLIEPKIEMFLKDRTRLIIQADRGTVYVEETAKGVNPRRGFLENNVRITYDRSTEMNPGPMAERPEDLIRFYADDVEFNNDLLEINTDSDVRVFSKEVDIIGQGLVIRWNDSPRELRMLMIKRGDYMAVKQAPKDLAMVPSASGQQRRDKTDEAPTEPTTALAELTEDDQIPLISALEIFEPQATSQSVQAATTATSGPASTMQPTTLAVRSRPASRPTTQPAYALDDENKPLGRNIYRATFHGRVNVDSDQGHLHGAKRVRMIFEWARQDESESEASSQPETWSEPSTTQPVAEKKEKDQGMLVITWEGPLIIEPIGYTPTPSSDRVRLGAEGERLTLFDEQVTVTCRSVLYMHPEGLGRIIGWDDEPVLLETADGQEVRCREIRFDSKRGLAQLVGPGEILGEQGESFVLKGDSDMAASQLTSKPASQYAVRWERSLVARFGEVQVPGDDGPDTKTTLTEALFTGGVRMDDSATGNFVEGPTLHLWMEMDPNSGDPYPARALMTGGVVARQDEIDITSEQVTITFRPETVTDEDGHKRSRPRPVTIVAEKNVTVTDRSRDEVTTARADRAEVDAIAETAVLFGKPATVAQGVRNIYGPEIHLDQNRESVRVAGAGGLTFLSNRDFAGRKIDKPMPVKLTWAEEMRFDGRNNVADLDGKVRLVSGLHSISGKTMRVTFSNVEPDEPASQPTETETSGSALEMKSLTKRDLATVLVTGDVVIDSRERDAQEKLLQWRHLTGEQVMYDAEAREFTSFGAGTLLLVDYRPPEPKSDANELSSGLDSLAGGGMDSPWETVFAWRKQMQLLETKRLVILQGDVAMVHRSGRHVKRREGLNLPDWPTLDDGRTTTLGCEKLLARFSEPKEKGETPRDSAGQLESSSVMGDLELFTATRDVSLRDGEWELRGARLRYNRRYGVAVLSGYLEGEEPRNAEVSQENPLKGISRPMSAPQFNCYLEGGHVKRVEVSKFHGGGQ